MSSFLKKALFSLLIAFLSIHSSLSGQHPSWQNFTTSNGLPSNEIYGMMQDSHGFLWFATSQGICRFNGYEFHRPVDTSSAIMGSAFNVSEDAQGRIWYNHLDVTFSIIENDTVKPWRYNEVLYEYRDKFASFGNFSLEADGTWWLPLLDLGILVVKPDGSHRLIQGKGKNIFIFTEVAGKSIYSNQYPKDRTALRLQERRTESPEVVFWKDGKEISLGNLPVSPKAQKIGKQFEVLYLPNGDFIICYYQTFYLFRDFKLVWHGQKELWLNQIYTAPDGSILLGCGSGKNQGLLRFRTLQDFQRDSFVNLLPEHSVSRILIDQEGGLWASTTDKGVFYSKNPGLDILDLSGGLPSNHVIQLATNGADKIFVGSRSGEICSINRYNGRITSMASILPTGNAEFNLLYYDPLTQWLWSGPFLSYLKNNHWTNFKNYRTGKVATPIFAIKKINPGQSGKNWWASSTYGFYSIDPRSGTGTKIPEDAMIYGKRTFSVTEDLDGTLWVTIPEGLRIWRNERYELPPFDHPALRFPARNVALLPASVGGGLAIGLRGGGLLLRDKTGRFTQLTVQNGLTSDVISNLKVSPEGIIYAPTNQGLNIISPESDGKWRVETLTTKHGLPSNQVNDVLWLDQELWLATDKGIVRFKERPRQTLMPMPLLEKFISNNRNVAFSQNLQLAHDQNNLSLHFFSLHFRSGGEIPYRYRLLGADTAFVYTFAREVNFANLSTGQYTCEVQAQNEDGQWSESARWAFAILPPWWATLWFRVIVAAALAAAAYMLYQNHLQSIRNDAAEREKIKELESAALRAQMNPHFIFNCLQAIQTFIAKNNRDAATIYLARFAKLVRLALHGSVDGLHTLAEEIAMLESYLYLEQLRFHGKFEFSVHAQEGLDTAGINFPPLLVQPFVENALLHGLQEREFGGRVEVVFASKDNFLEVTVTDNGQGFSEKKTTEKSPHKSVGMMLTQKRLDLLKGDGKVGAEHLVRETVLDGEGNPVGAQVKILIPI
jgi:ligand-binding sensor domain-containing protein